MPERFRQYFFCLALLPFASSADVVSFNNGDRLRGTIIAMQQGVIRFDSANLGMLEIPIDKIASFETEQAAELHFQDGTVLKRKVTLAQQGKVGLAPGEIISVAPVPLAAIKEINPPAPEPPGWHGRMSGGLLVDRGNTESQDAQVQVNTSRETDQDRIILDAEYIERRETDPDSGSRCAL